MNALFSLLQQVISANGLLARGLNKLSDIFQLVLRLYVASVFFKSGLTKIQDFSSTIALFENEYKVPIFSPWFAAVSGTAAELVLPVLLVMGIASRPVAIALFVFNYIAYVSYPDISAAGVKDHMIWGTMLLVIVFHGGGKIALDQWLERFWKKPMSI